MTECKRDYYDIGIQLDIGPSKVLAVSGNGLVTIFDKNDGSIEHREYQPGTSGMVFGIRMLSDRAVTGGDDGIVNILQRNSAYEWKFVKSLAGSRGITHIDGNEDWLCAGKFGFQM